MTCMSELPPALFDLYAERRFRRAYDAIAGFENAEVTENSAKCEYGVDDPLDKSLDLDNDVETFTTLKRICDVERVDYDDGLNALSVIIMDCKTTETLEGIVIEEKRAFHTWIVKLSKNQRVLHSHRQVKWDATRGGNVDWIEDVPATSYLGMRTKTTEDVLKMLEEQRFMWDKPLDWSTVQ